jgi:DNA-directed RNA polymerase specialized sigma24 family protein
MDSAGQDQRERYLAAVDAAEVAGAQMVAALRATSEARLIVREHVMNGGRLSDLENVIQPQPLRAGVSNAIADLERARHEAQRQLFLLLQAEGQTMTDIAKMWGISRQLVSRMVNEPVADASP